MARILIVDDEPEVLRTLARMVRHIGHEPLTTSGGKQALELATGEELHAALVDIMMPQMDGIETIRALRTQFPRLPLVAMSGGGSLGLMQYLEMATKLGADATIEKPVELLRLRSVFQALLPPSST